MRKLIWLHIQARHRMTNSTRKLNAFFFNMVLQKAKYTSSINYDDSSKVHCYVHKL